ncbi:MAG: DUF6115 domain-containing protein [Halanaerobiaceae bacterium]
MGWFLILIGVFLLAFAMYRIYNEISSLEEGSINVTGTVNRLRKTKESSQVDDKLLENITNKIINFEREMDFNYQQLKKTNDKMSSIIKEIYKKEEEINNKLKEMKVDIPSNKMVSNSNILEDNKTEENFSDILSKSIDEEYLVPEKYLEIFELYKTGMTADEIAEKLDIGVGETRLVFKLYGKEAKNV